MDAVEPSESPQKPREELALVRPPAEPPSTLRPLNGPEKLNDAWRYSTPLHGAPGAAPTQYANPMKPRGTERASMLFRTPAPGTVTEIDPDGSVRTRTLSQEDIDQERADRVFGESFREQGMSLGDAHPFRIRMGWRIVRQMARLRGLVQADEGLRDLGYLQEFNESDSQDLWTRPSVIADRPPRGEGYMYWRSVLAPMKEAMMLEKELGYCEWRWDLKQWIYEKGFGLLPPPVPKRYRASNGDVSQSYNVQADWNLRYYCDVVDEIAAHLQIFGPGEFEQKNRLGIYGLSDVRLIRGLFPSQFEIITYEELLIERTISLLEKTSQRKTKRTLMEEHGYMPFEADQIIRLSLTRLMDDQRTDIEQRKSLHVARLEHALQRAVESCNLPEEVKIHKQLAVVEGVNRIEDSTVGDDWRDAIRTVVNKAQQRAIDEDIIDTHATERLVLPEN